NYVPAEGAAQGHNLHDLMSPFNVTPEDVLDVRALGYRYDTQGDSAGGASIPEPGGAGSPVKPNPDPATVVLLAAGGGGPLGRGMRRPPGSAARVAMARPPSAS